MNSDEGDNRVTIGEDQHHAWATEVENYKSHLDETDLPDSYKVNLVVAYQRQLVDIYIKSNL